MAVATGAEMTAVSAARGRRTITAEDFFVAHFTTALEPDELLTEVAFPAVKPGTGTAFEEMARRHGDFAVVGVAATLHLDGGVIDEATVVLTGMGATPVRATSAESALVGQRPGAECFESAASDAAAETDPPSDLHGTSAYRRHVAQILIQRSLQRAVATIGAAP